MMKSITTLFYLMFVSATLFSQETFNANFVDSALRIDYQCCGNHDNMEYYIEQFKQEPFWGGSKKNLIDTFNYGERFIRVFDISGKKELYSRGYSTLSYEWQTTEESKTTKRCFYESLQVPYPKQKVKIKIETRNKNNTFNTVLETIFDPTDIFVKKEFVPSYFSKKILDSGVSEKKVDIVIISEGYSIAQLNKFTKDANHFMNMFFTWSPFHELKNKFNFWIVFVPSIDNGTDIPGEGIWKNTSISSSFYTFGSERYLTPGDVKTMHDVAACVPYDQICILVNSEKYGGGGIYNFYNICTSDNEYSNFVFMHEFGHGFASLADEYYGSETSYQEFFDLSIEPYQDNITTLVNFKGKWEDMIEPGTPIPTPATEPYLDKIGVFEGAGYVEKGIYRPTFNSSMKSKINNDYGPVNSRIIRKMVSFYSE